MSTEILLLGSTGQVGGQLARLLGPSTVSVGREEADLLLPDSLRSAVVRHRPWLVINAAADTAVDRAETAPEPARLGNAVAPEVLAQACRDVGARLIHFSTDYAFAGDSTRPYREDDPVSPVNAYGRFKLDGEQAVLNADRRHLVFRLSWVYDTRGRNFALTMLRLAREGRSIRVVDDQVGSPTYARFIAEAVTRVALPLGASEDGGLYHLSAGGQTSWCGFANELLTQAMGSNAPVVQGIPTSEYPTPAARPAYSVLDNSAFRGRFGFALPDWREEVKEWAQDLTVRERNDRSAG